MKKVIAIFLLFVTLGTNAFVKASLHYCGESLTQIAFGNEHGDPCYCAETGNMDCCKDVVVKLSPFNDLVLNTASSAPNLIIQDICFLQIFIQKFDSPLFSHIHGTIDEGPPLLLFKQQGPFLSIFRI